METNFFTVKQNNESGFALLLTLVVVSVILAIGLSLLHITLKQFTLSSIARDSEIAFHAANIGIECMRYHRADETIRSQLLNYSRPSLTCANVSASVLSGNVSQQQVIFDGQKVNNFRFAFNLPKDELDPNSQNDLCIDTSLYIVNNKLSSALSYNFLANEGIGAATCTAGTICTTVFSRGYNRSCDSLNSILTVQRELTVQF